MTCGLFTPLLPLPYDLLEPVEAQDLRRHLDGCGRCVADREALTAAIARACPAPQQLPPAAWQGVTASLETEAARFSLDVDALLAEQLSLTPVGVRELRAQDRRVGTRIGSYVLLERLAIGAMGAVYRGYDPARHLEVALKMIPLPEGRNQRLRARFERHGAAFEKVVHPNVARVFEPVATEGALWTVQEFVRGRDLSEHFRQHGRCSPLEAVAIAISIARALGAAHRAGLLHHDVKPHNVLLTDDGGIKLTDFQAPPPVGLTLTRCGGMMGNPAYVSPERCLAKREVDGRSDLYSLGVVLYELLTGRRPYVAQTTMELFTKIITGGIAPPTVELPRAHQQVLGQLLARDPDDRYEDADALVADLEALQHGLPVAADGPLPWLPKPLVSQNTKRAGAWIALLGLGLLALLLLAWLIAT